MLDNKGRVVLVVAAHPDDEILGCGGTIAWHKDRGDRVHIRIFAEGLTSRYGHSDYSLDELHRCAHKAADVVNADSIQLFKLPDNRLDSIDRLDITQCIEKELSYIRPDIVYVHHCGDVNIDHRRLHECVVTACRPIPGSSVQDLFSYEVPSSTEWQTSGSAPPFVPNMFIDVSSQMERKIKALQIYEHEMRLWPHPRSVKAIEHLMRYRGSQVGREAAEAFIVLRHVS